MRTPLALLGIVLVVSQVACQEREEWDKDLSIDEIFMKIAQKSDTALQLKQDDGTVLVELDMKYTKEQWNEIKNGGMILDFALPGDKRGSRRRTKRKAIQGKRWTQSEIPYEISPAFSQKDKRIIQEAMNDYQRNTCIRFREARSRDENKLVFQNGGGCSSFVGMAGGKQVLTLAPGCRSKGIILHELGHALGFHHEQTRPDRDRHVVIESDNIVPGLEYNFNRYTWTTLKDYNVPYDYTSIMHYGEKAFSKNGRETILARKRGFQNKMGNRNGLTFMDIKTANLMYNCHARCGDKKCPAEAFMDQYCRCMCPGNPVTECTRTGTSQGAGRGTDRETSGGNGRGTDRETNRGNGRETGRETGRGTGRGSNGRGTDQENNRGNGRGTGRETGRGKETVDRTTTTNNRGECRDTSEGCQRWKDSGYCVKDHQYYSHMKVNCNRTCGFCRTTGGQGTGTTGKGECANTLKECDFWARSGYCNVKNYFEYMTNKCPKACSRCNYVKTTMPLTTTAPEDVTCRNKMNQCNFWLKQGYCTKKRYLSFLKENCAKACGTCTTGQRGEQLKTTAPPAMCKDESRGCPLWRGKGYCQKDGYKGYMKENCRKTCGFC